MALPEELKTIQGIAKGDKNCPHTCMSSLFKNRSKIESPSDEQIFLLENQVQQPSQKHPNSN